MAKRETARTDGLTAGKTAGNGSWKRQGRRVHDWRNRDRGADSGTATPTVDRWTLVWNETNRRARAWGRAHHGNNLNHASWNALFERVRDELLGVAWAVEQRREYARVADFGREVAV